MNIVSTDSTTINDRPGWERVVLVGGPYSGHRYTVPQTQDELVLHDDAEPHRYLRANGRPELHHESRVEAAFGGRR